MMNVTLSAAARRANQAVDFRKGQVRLLAHMLSASNETAAMPNTRTTTAIGS